jgi:uncharacterized membrane protein YfhO
MGSSLGLNTKYLVFNPNEEPIQNKQAMGNVWLVSNIHWSQNADQEITALKQVDLHQTAVIDKSFQSLFTEQNYQPHSGDIQLKSYAPNELVYHFSSSQPQLAVFSEIYYPGWRSSIDGQEVPHGRANYILRAMNVPAGKHEVEFSFDPVSLHVTENIATIALGLLALAALAMAFLKIKAYRKA